MKDQVFIAGLSGKKFDIERLKRKLSGKAKLINKPNIKPHPVLWTSTLEGNSTDWMNWCSYEMPHWLGDQGVILEVKSSAKILKIDSDEAWLAICEEFAEENESFLGHNYCKIDWVKVQKKGYDGVHHARGRYAPSWDVESTAWLNPSVLTIKEVVDIDKGCRYDWDSDEPDGGYKPPSIVRKALQQMMIKSITNKYLMGGI